jgi:hypothetical protein
MAIAHVQGNHAGANANSTSIAVTLTNPVGSGNTVCGAVTFDSGSGANISSITDDKGNAYTISDNVNDGTNFQRMAVCLGQYHQRPEDRHC